MGGSGTSAARRLVSVERAGARLGLRWELFSREVSPKPRSLARCCSSPSVRGRVARIERSGFAPEFIVLALVRVIEVSAVGAVVTPSRVELADPCVDSVSAKATTD